MIDKRLEWILLIFLAVGGILLWCHFSLPRYQSIDLSISQSKASDIAKNYLKNDQNVDIDSYKMAVKFEVDDGADRYLQRTIGVDAAQNLIHRLHYDMFCWVIRFFKEKQKEEFNVAISSATGEVIGFHHYIEDTASRPTLDKERSRQLAINFLRTKFGFNPDHFITHAEDAHKFDNRLEYAFSWQDKDVDIPWSKVKNAGFAKYLTSVTVSGNEILYFSKARFEIPDGFNRYIANLKQTGENLILVFRIFYLALITFSIVVVVNRKSQVVTRSVKFFYIAIGIGIFVLMVIDVLNSYQDLMYGYPTTQSWGDYMVRQFIEGIIGPFFIAVGFVLPALAGESLRFEVSPEKKNRSFLSALLSSFCSVSIARQVFVGYIAAAFILGLQAFIFALGFKYCGVWDELSWLTQASTTLVPAFTALMIAFQASFSEESMFRLFAINFFKKYGVPTFLAVFFSAAMWGFGHTGYEIYPMWFRGVEVTCIGIMMGIFYLRYGIVCVIVAHFLIDSFLFSMPYLLKPQASFDFYSSLAIIFVPLLLGFISLIFNRNVQEKQLSVRFNSQQQFNYELLLQLCRSKTPEELVIFKKDLERHGWDAAIIQKVFEEKLS